MSKYSLDDLVRITGLTKRTIRYYIQTGLASRPEGDRRTAFYTDKHLEELLRVKRLTAEGFSLERVKTLMNAPVTLPQEAPVPGKVSVRSHVFIAPGVELSIDPLEAGLANEELRSIAKAVLERLSVLQSSK